MTKAIVYGVTGQDGSYLSELLLNKGYTVYGIARRTSGDNTQRLPTILNKKNFNLVQGDVTDTGSIYRLLHEVEPDEVYNLAAQSFVGASFDQPILTSDVTGLGTLRVLDAIKEYSPDSKFYQASSSEMYGNAPGIKNEKSYFKPLL